MALAKLRKGTEFLVPSSGNSGNAKRPGFISWKDGDAKTVAFLTPIESIPIVRWHNFIKIPAPQSPQGFRYATFMCRKDPAWLEESEGHCYLCDIIGHKPDEKHVAVAIELEPIREGRKVVELKVKTRTYQRDDGTVTEYPQWGLVIQKLSNFFSYFSAWREKYDTEITEVAFDITRKGGDKTTTYPVFPIETAEIPDLSEFMDNIPTLEDILENLGSLEHYAERGGIEPGSQESPFKNDDEESTSTQVAESDETSSKISKFEELKLKLEADKAKVSSGDSYGG